LKPDRSPTTRRRWTAFVRSTDRRTSFRRQGEDILIFSRDSTFPASGTHRTIALKAHFGIFCSLVIDCSTRRVLKENGPFFLNAGFDLMDRYVVTEQEDGYRKLLGLVSAIKGDMLTVTRPDGQVVQTDAKNVYLEASRANFDDYILHTHGAQRDAIVERIRQSISIFNGGENKKARIDKLKQYIQSKTIPLIDGTRIEIEDSPDIQRDCDQMQKPVFVFNDNGEADWAEKGLTSYGPYTKRTFDRNDPSICVICAQHDKGRVEQRSGPGFLNG
jgi:hypothetical protein